MRKLVRDGCLYVITAAGGPGWYTHHWCEELLYLPELVELLLPLKTDSSFIRSQIIEVLEKAGYIDNKEVITESLDRLIVYQIPLKSFFRVNFSPFDGYERKNGAEYIERHIEGYWIVADEGDN